MLISCEDELLNLSPISQVSTGNFYQTESDFNSAVLAAYNSLQQLNNNVNWKMQEIRADNAYADPTRREGNQYIDNFEVAVTDGDVAGFWRISYNAIFKTNIILNKIGDIDLIEQKKDLIIGQAKFIRALVYFDLVRSFGDVPLVTKVPSLSESYEMGRAPLEEVYNTIINDLSDAAELLPLEYELDSDIGRATKGAANGLLGKVYLTIGKHQDAKSVLEKVINSGIYSLLPSFSDIWKIENQNNAEIVFAIQYSDGTGNGNEFNYIFAPLTRGADINPGTGLGMSRPTAELIRAFDEEDTRMSSTLSPYEINPNTNDTVSNAYFRKFLANQQVRDGGQDWPILRYSDILLMYAEALNELDDLNGAIDQLNLVRLRAFGGNEEKLYSTESITNSNQFKDILLNERRLELACENHRWFDLLRFGKAEEFLQTEIRVEDYKTGMDLLIYNTSMQEFERLYPIPIDEIEKHNGNLDQNPGY